jgi:GWxTD domain-containing protein
MKKNGCRGILVFIILLCTVTGSYAIPPRENEEYTLADKQAEFYFDAVAFRSSKQDMARIDIYGLVPYQLLAFIATENSYICDYDIQITAYDSLGNNIHSEKIDRTVVEEEYFESLGGSGKFDYFFKSIDVNPGSYRVKLDVIDKTTNQEYHKTRSISAPNFYNHPLVLSGLLLISSIEENQGKYTITPHVDDNVSMLKDGWFVFFETYHTGEGLEADFEYSIISETGKLILRDTKEDKKIKNGVTRHYLKIPYPNGLIAGKYKLDIALMNKEVDSINAIALSTRSISNKPTFGSYVLADLDQAIDQLIYVANSDAVKYIIAGLTEEERRNRFDSFWEGLDPSPDTERNEAFDEFYLRIAYANNHFKTYSTGWRTDMGHVYVVFGPPMQIESITNNGQNFQRWRYEGNREFLFADRNGFGDWRLYSPSGFIERYEYDRYE